MGMTWQRRWAAAAFGMSMIVTTGACAQTASDPAAHRANTALVSEVAARLARGGTIRADFTQTQTLAAMTRPLVSTGSLLFDRASGVVWRIDTPYKATYVITDGGVREVGADGQRARGDARNVAQVSRMMRGMLGGDLSGLYAQFDVDASGTPERWRLTLRPNQPQLAQAIRTLQMTGGAYLKTLGMTFANGNVTTLEFAGTARVDAPAPAERAWLEAR
ncbi:outer membrane lipoprotein carrier protein LolA [Burkholderia sp. Bp9002]|nr:outer membrane lipoprotein carrier protein LolA [Burkholderia sp. Bp9002]